MLKANKSFVAAASFSYNSPANSQNQNVVINIKDQDVKVKYGPEENDIKEIDGIAVVKSRDIDDAIKNTETTFGHLDAINTIKALSLIIDIMKNNPLIINKKIVAEEQSLAELIRLITTADNVEINTEEMDSFCCGKSKYRIIRNIWIYKDDEQYGIAQSPQVAQFLVNYDISYNICV